MFEVQLSLICIKLITNHKVGHKVIVGEVHSSVSLKLYNLLPGQAKILFPQETLVSTSEVNTACPLLL